MLPRIIEYLASQELASGGRLARPARLQFVFPLVPPGFQLVFSIVPPFNAYAAIKYAMTYECLPGTIYLETTQGGDQYIAGTIEADQMRTMIPYFVLYTIGNPINVRLANQSVLAQQAIGTQYMLVIDTVENFGAVQEHLAALSCLRTNELAVETNELLRQIANIGPRPPIIGGV